jgi:hypothetical protein
MESHSPERKYEDRTSQNIGLEDLRSKNETKKLSLRKEKRNRDKILSIKEKLNFLVESHYSIHLNLLKTDNNDIRNFSIDDQNPYNSMKKLKYLLLSKDDNEVKFGLWATRKYFQNLMKILYFNEKNNYTKKLSENEIKKGNQLDAFIENNIIDLIFYIMAQSIEKNDKNGYINIYEAIWILINMCCIYPEKEEKKIEFINTFKKSSNLNILINLIQNNTPQEIIVNLLTLIYNIAIGEIEIKNIMINSPLILLLFTYLKTNQNINQNILLKIYKILYLLCSNFNNFDVDACKKLFKIFSLPIYNFKDKEMIINCLEILKNLSSIKNPEIENCFNDMNLFAALNDIIFNNTIDDNEIIIILILDIFCNLIEKDNPELQNSIINSGNFLKFYNNLLIKYKYEQKIKNYMVDENLIVSINNLILFNREECVKFILGEGNEILNYFMECAKCVFSELKNSGMKSLINILMDQENEININILYDIVNIIIGIVSIKEFRKCFSECAKAIFIIIKKSEIMKFNNELKNYLINKGFENFLDEYDNYLLNESNIFGIDKDEIENIHNIIEEIKYFLN